MFCDPNHMLADDLLNAYEGLGRPARILKGKSLEVFTSICNGRDKWDARRDILLYAASILEKVNDQDARITLMHIYENLPARYRSDAIRIGLDIIKNARNNMEEIEYKYWTALLLYKDNKLTQAEELLTDSYCKRPESMTSCRFLAEIYVKRNDLDKALDILYSYKNSCYYIKHTIKYIGPVLRRGEPERYEIKSMEEDPRQYIDAVISDIENKKANGYVYKPRKKIE